MESRWPVMDEGHEDHDFSFVAFVIFVSFVVANVINGYVKSRFRSPGSAS
jgi:hypothetical protein